MSRQTAKKRIRAAQQRRRRDEGKIPFTQQLRQRGPWLAGLSLVALSLLLVLVCFWGLSPAGPPVTEGQTSRVRVTAEFPFRYESEILTRQAKAEVRLRVPPVYRIDLQAYMRFRDYLQELQTNLVLYAREGIPEGVEAPRLTPAEVQRFLREYPQGDPYSLNPEVWANFLNGTTFANGEAALQEGLLLLGEILGQGVYSLEAGGVGPRQGELSLFDLEQEQRGLADARLLTREEALSELRIQLSAINIPRAASVALFRILADGLRPNVVHDLVRSRERLAEAEAAIGTLTVAVQAGDVLIERGRPVTALQVEQLTAYRQELASRETSTLGVSPLLLEQTLLTFLIVFAAALVVRTEGNLAAIRVRRHILTAVVVLFNLTLIRMTLELSETEMLTSHATFIAILPFLAPIAFGPMILAILAGPRQGILGAGIIALFNALMQGGSIPILIISFLGALVAVYASKGIQVRARVVRAGLAAGAFMAVAAVFRSIYVGFDFSHLVPQMGTALAVGLITGISVVGILPILEHIFKYTTDITLLELTDFNHPLLRRLQVVAPGSYHHSLMVANLSENAALAVGANPLICRVCSLYHDIGKMHKPEYFAENQREGVNPHHERNPSMSALIIKAHIKEGVTLAKEYKLPEIIMDVIRQHHGTSLIAYFYHKAREEQKNTPNPFPQGSSNGGKVEESDYRYEGPKPQFKESAIILLADSVEAASRSLKKVTPQSIDELVEKIFRSRLDDEQLSDTPVTFQELKEIRKSFSFTLLNMLHARVEYPKEALEGKKREAIQVSAPAASVVSPSAPLTPAESVPESPAEKAPESPSKKVPVSAGNSPSKRP